MNARIAVALAAALGAAGIAAALGYLAATRSAQTPAAMSTSPARSATAAPAPEPARTVLYWYDPMRPDVKFVRPGKSPFMDMELVPKYADEAAGAGVSIDPRMAQNLGVRTAAAEAGAFWRRVDTGGSVQADERRIVSVQSRVTGWIERLHVRAVNDRVARGQALAEIYAPDLLAAQEEYLLRVARQDSSEPDRQLSPSGSTAGTDAPGTTTRTTRRTRTAPTTSTATASSPRSGSRTPKGAGWPSPATRA